MNCKVLATNFGGLGDQILFLPSIEILEKIFEKNKIFFMTETRSKNIVQLTDLIEEKNIIEFNYKNGNFFSLASKAFEFVKVLRSGNFDYVFCTGTNPLIPFMLFLSGIKHRYYIKSKPKLNLNFPQASSDDKYVAKILFEPVNNFLKDKTYEFKNPEIKLELIEKKITHRNELKEILFNNKNKIAIHPGTSKLSLEKNINKRWQLDKWIELIQRILEEDKDTMVYLCGGREDKEICEQISEKLQSSSLINCHSLLEKNAANLAYLFSEMNSIICLDSAPMHIAYSLSKDGEYLNKRIIALFSVTNHKNLIPADHKNISVLESINSQTEENNWDLEKILSLLNYKNE